MTTKTAKHTWYVPNTPDLLNWALYQLSKRDNLVGEPTVEYVVGGDCKVTYEVRDDD